MEKRLMNSPNKVAKATVSERYQGVAVLLPCLNEATSIIEVVNGFQRHLPGCQVYVFDNASTDGTAEVAATRGAIVRHVPKRGKGHVVRQMFRDIEADIYVIADGDLTYDPSAAPEMIKKLRQGILDVVIGVRDGDGADQYRPGHRVGNRMLTGCIARLFSAELSDMLSGYRVMSRRFVKSFPIEAKGFEIETETTVHMLQLNAPYAEFKTDYRARAEDSDSKLRTFSDGSLILQTIVGLTILERPMSVFGGIGLVASLVGMGMFLPVLLEFQQTGLVGRFPTLIVSVFFELIGLVSIFTGMILAGTTRTRRDMKRLAYLAIPAPSAR